MLLDNPTINKPGQPQPLSDELTAKGRMQVENLLSLQKAFSTYLETVNQNWLAHMRSESALAMQFANKLAETHSIVDTTTACQEWTDQRMELFTKDSSRFLADTQRMIESGLQVLANSWTAGA
jgi:hypothetical protein